VRAYGGGKKGPVAEQIVPSTIYITLSIRDYGSLYALKCFFVFLFYFLKNYF